MIRLFTIIVVIVLYFIPFYQSNYQIERKKELSVREICSAPIKSHPSDSTPFYRETFINVEKPGSICHVSSITTAINGKMACVWYSGSREGAADVAIYFSIYNEIDGTWNSPAVIVNRHLCSRELRRYVKKVGNPMLFTDREGNIWLFYASIFAGGWSGSSINYKVSKDDGQTWTKSRKMILSPFFNLTNNVKNSGVNLDTGTFLIPTYHEFINKFSQFIWMIDVENYEIYRIGGGRDIIQPVLISDEGKTIITFFRNTQKSEKKFILLSKSLDTGKTWSDVTNTSLPNPNSGFDIIKLTNSDLLGVVNNSFKDRYSLSLVLSKDNGKSWKVLKVLENCIGKEYSYPSISKSLSGIYHITYTYERRRIKHIVFNGAWVKKLEESAY